jgi:DNA-binding transcriptional MerR regulator
MTATFTITDLAQEFGVTTRTIRHYEAQGLLNPQRRGVVRVFSGRDRVRLKLALRGKRLGFSLQEIKELFDLYDLSKDERHQLEAFLAKLEKRKAILEQQREDIEVMLQEVEFFAVQCRRLLARERHGDARVREASEDVNVRPALTR